MIHKNSEVWRQCQKAAEARIAFLQQTLERTKMDIHETQVVRGRIAELRHFFDLSPPGET